MNRPQLIAQRREYKSKLMHWKGQQKKAKQQIEKYLDLIDSINIKIDDIA
tara:strand:+ start:962 stop:1111 length:150 start_codon:yes stop_codon:yes gene_type:complete